MAPAEKFRRLRVGALLMDPGTGKTRVMIDLLHRRQARLKRVVWFAPVGAVHTIRQEWLKHTTLRPEDVHVFGARTRGGRLPDALVHIVGSESLSSSRRVTLAVAELIGPDTAAVFDESDQFRTPWAMRARRAEVFARGCGHRFLLTGTFANEGLPDVYQQFRLLDPAIIGYTSWYAFSRAHLVYSETQPGRITHTNDPELIAARIAPYVFEFSRDELHALPPVLHDTQYCALTDTQWEAYAQAKDEFLNQELERGESTLSDIRRLFTALQTIAAGYWNRRHRRTGVVQHLEFPSRRLALLESALDALPPGDRVVIWCKYTRSVQLVAELLRARGATVAEYHGEVSEADRAVNLEAFRTGRAQYLIGTPGTGGRGLNELSGTSWAVFFETSFKARERAQAESRLLGLRAQGRVTLIDLIADCPIEHRIHEALARKESACAAFLRELNASRLHGTQEALLRGL